MRCHKCGFDDCGMANPRGGSLDPRYMQSILDDMAPANPGEDLCTYGGTGAALVATDLLYQLRYVENKFIAALKKYGNHLHSCPKRNKSDIRMDRDNNCNCGYEKSFTAVV